MTPCVVPPADFHHRLRYRKCKITVVSRLGVDHRIFERNALRIVFCEPPFGSLLVGEDLKVIVNEHGHLTIL
jgi:hypothetical protein